MSNHRPPEWERLTVDAHRRKPYHLYRPAVNCRVGRTPRATPGGEPCADGDPVAEAAKRAALRLIRPEDERRDALFAAVLEHAKTTPEWSRTLNPTETEAWANKLGGYAEAINAAAGPAALDRTYCYEVGQRIGWRCGRFDHHPAHQKRAAYRRAAKAREKNADRNAGIFRTASPGCRFASSPLGTDCRGAGLNTSWHAANRTPTEAGKHTANRHQAAGLPSLDYSSLSPGPPARESKPARARRTRPGFAIPSGIGTTVRRQGSDSVDRLKEQPQPDRPPMPVGSGEAGQASGQALAPTRPSAHPGDKRPRKLPAGRLASDDATVGRGKGRNREVGAPKRPTHPGRIAAPRRSHQPPTDRPDPALPTERPPRPTLDLTPEQFAKREARQAKYAWFANPPPTEPEPQPNE